MIDLRCKKIKNTIVLDLVKFSEFLKIDDNKSCNIKDSIMTKYICLIVVITLGLWAPAFANNNPNPMGLLQSTYRYNGLFENPFLTTNRVVKGVVYVSAVELKEIKPKKLFFKGEVSSIAHFDVSFTKEGIVEYVLGKGNYVFSSILENDAKVVRQGTPIARMNEALLKEEIKNAKNRRKLATMGFEYLDKQTKAQENLARKKIITPFALESARIALFSKLMDYENTKKETDAILLANQDPNVYSTKSGLITDVHVLPGAHVTLGTPAVSVMQMDPILVKIACPTERLGLLHKKLSALVYPIGFNKPYVAMLEVKQDDPEHVYVHIPNSVVISSKLTSMQNKIPKVFSVFPVKDLLNPNTEAFYLSLKSDKEKRKPILCIPEETIRHDGKGHYVFKIKDINVANEQERIPKVFTVERISIELGNTTMNMMYGTGNPKRVKSIIDKGKIRRGDLLVGDAQPSLKGGDRAILVGFYWKFYPNQQVKVQIPGLTKRGIYVPSKAVIHQDANEDYVYLIQNNVAKLKKVNVTGAYGNYCLITGEGIYPGERAVIIDTPSLFDALYDGVKVKVVNTVDAPEFMAHDHALNFNYQVGESSTASERTRNSSYSRRRNRSGNFGDILKGRILDQISSMF